MRAKGSYTVEAVFLFPMILFLIVFMLQLSMTWYENLQQTSENTEAVTELETRDYFLDASVLKAIKEQLENYELQMILHNEIPSLLDFQVIIADGKAEYLYDVTGMQSLEKQFSFLTLGEKQLRFFLQNLIYVKNAMEEYLLDDQNLSFSPAMIFYDRFAKRIRFCYVPGLAEHPPCDIRGLFEQLLQHLDHSDVAAVRLGYDMYERSAQSEFLREDCIDCLTNSGSEKSAWISERQALQEEDDFENVAETEERRLPDRGPVSAVEAGFVREEKSSGFWRRKRWHKRREQIDYSQILDEEQRRFYAAEEISGSPETEIFSAEDEGTAWKLVYKGNGEESDFVLEDFPFWIGTDEGKVQGVLTARTVSRVHAKLSMKEDRIYLEDYNSTNGTYVNCRMIPMNTPTELQSGDRIFFATEEYLLSGQGLRPGNSDRTV